MSYERGTIKLIRVGSEMTYLQFLVLVYTLMEASIEELRLTLKYVTRVVSGALLAFDIVDGADLSHYLTLPDVVRWPVYVISELRNLFQVREEEDIIQEYREAEVEAREEEVREEEEEVREEEVREQEVRDGEEDVRNEQIREEEYDHHYERGERLSRFIDDIMSEFNMHYSFSDSNNALIEHQTGEEDHGMKQTMIMMKVGIMKKTAMMMKTVNMKFGVMKEKKK